MPLISVRHRQIKIAAFDAVLMSSANIQNLDVNRGYEPAPSSGLRPPSPPSGEREGVRGRFVESPLSLLRMHWDHEPPLTRPSATLSPSDGEREGVRGRFMERVADWPGDWKFMGFQLRLKLSQLSRPPPEKLIRQLSG